MDTILCLASFDASRGQRPDLVSFAKAVSTQRNPSLVGDAGFRLGRGFAGHIRRLSDQLMEFHESVLDVLSLGPVSIRGQDQMARFAYPIGFDLLQPCPGEIRNPFGSVNLESELHLGADCPRSLD